MSQDYGRLNAFEYLQGIRDEWGHSITPINRFDSFALYSARSMLRANSNVSYLGMSKKKLHESLPDFVRTIYDHVYAEVENLSVCETGPGLGVALYEIHQLGVQYNNIPFLESISLEAINPFYGPVVINEKLYFEDLEGDLFLQQQHIGDIKNVSGLDDRDIIFDQLGAFFYTEPILAMSKRVFDTYDRLSNIGCFIQTPRTFNPGTVVDANDIVISNGISIVAFKPGVSDILGYMPQSLIQEKVPIEDLVKQSLDL